MNNQRFDDARVAIADTLPANRDIIKTCLTDIGFRHLRFCENVEEARLVVELGEVDLLFCDVSHDDTELALMVRELRDMEQQGDAFLTGCHAGLGADDCGHPPDRQLRH